MAIVQQRDSTQNVTSQTITTTTETAVQTSNQVPMPFVTAKVVVSAVVVQSPGTGTTSVTLRIYRGASIAAGTLLASYGNVVTAGNQTTLTIEFADVVSGFGTVQYTLSYQQAGATANGTVLAANLDVEVISG